VNISVIILAAGAASRMGSPKQILHFKNTTFLDHAISKAKASKATNVCCVLGANLKVVKAAVKNTSVSFVENLNWKEGLSSSIVTGVNYITSLQKQPDGILVMLCDQPFLDTAYINLLIDTYTHSTKSIIASNYGAKNGVPAIFPKESFKMLLALKGDIGAKILLNSSVFNVVSVIPDNLDVLKDIDTPNDYLKLKERGL